MTPAENASLKITEKDLAVVAEVIEEGIKLRKDLAEVKKLQPKKRKELQDRAKDWGKKLSKYQKEIASMFGDVEMEVEEGEESVTVIKGLQAEQRAIFDRLGMPA